MLAILAGIYAADLVSGLLHWAFDTWFDEDTTFLRRMVLQVREHHVYPNRIFHINFLHDAGTLSWIALILTGPPILWAILSGAGHLECDLEDGEGRLVARGASVCAIREAG